MLLPLLILLFAQNANALLVAETPLELYYHNEMIVLGKVISIKENADGFSTQYDIKVEEYVKNKKPQDLITVFGTYFSIPSPPKFEKGDMALLLLNKAKDGRYEISPLSFKAKAGCDVHQILGMQAFPDEPLPRGIPSAGYQIDENCIGSIAKPTGSAFVSPLKQFRSGIIAENTVCKEGLHLVIKAENNSPACVIPEHVTKLFERGWAKHA